jgi:hypothetical protein
MDLIRTLGFVASALSSYAAFGLKIAQFRRSRDDAAYRVLILVLLLQCVTFSLGVVALTTDRLLGVGNLAVLLLHLSAVAYCICAEVLLLRWTSSLAAARPHVIRWIAFGAVAAGCLVMLFVGARIDRLPATDLNTGSDRPLVIAYLLIFMLSQALPCLTIIRQCVPYSRLAEPGWLQRALRVLAAAAALLLGYCLSRVTIILLSTEDVGVGDAAILPSLFSAAGIVTLNVGLTMQSWGPRLGRVQRWFADYAAYRALYPLWQALYQASPEISLEQPSRSLTDLAYRLHRRVIEIDDGRRALRPYMEESARSTAGSTMVDDRLPEIEAARIHRALQAKLAGRELQFDVDAAGPPGQDANTLGAEVRWLRQVSRSFAEHRIDRPDGEQEA